MGVVVTEARANAIGVVTLVACGLAAIAVRAYDLYAWAESRRPV